MSFLHRIPSKYRSNPFIIYTLIFLPICAIIVLFFSLKGLTFIGRDDAFKQYLNYMIFYSDYLKSFLKNIFFEHNFSLTEWSFAFGEGDEIIANGNYYGYGDPLYLFSILFNRDNMYIFYEISTMVRLYLSGIAFILMCRELIPNPSSVLQIPSGALLYTFCTRNLSSIHNFTLFIIPMVYLPLIIWGIERMLRKKSALVLSLSLMFLSLSSFYFTLLSGPPLAIYVLLRLIFLYKKNIGLYISPLLKIAGAAMLGLLLSSVILLPSLSAALISPRQGLKFTIHLFQEPLFYLELPRYYLKIIPAASFAAIVLLFTIRKKYTFLKTLIILTTIMYCLQLADYIFSGFAFPETRWGYIRCLIFAYAFTRLWNEFTETLKKNILPVSAALTAYVLLCYLLEDSRGEEAFLSLALSACFILLLSLDSIRSKYKEYILMLFCVLSSCILIPYRFSSELLEKVVPLNSFPNIYNDNESLAIELIRSFAGPDPTDPLTRYTGDLPENNSGLIRDLSSTNYYWSIPSPYAYNFRRNLAMLSTPVYIYSNYNARTVAQEISSIKYFVSNSEKVPYGYSFMTSINVNEAEEEQRLDALKKELGTDELTDYQISSVKSKTENYKYIHQNDYSLPLGSTYDSYIPYDTYMRMSAPEKEWSMLDAVTLKDYSEDPSHIFKGTKDYLDNIHRLDAKAVVSDEITVRGDQYISPIGGAIDLSFDAPAPRNCEYYCYIEGIEHEEITAYDLYFGDDEKYDPQHHFNKVNWDFLPANEKRDIIKEHLTDRPSSEGHIYVEAPDGDEAHIIYDPPYKKQYNDRHDYVVNLGYYEDGLDSVRVSFTQPTILTLKNISVYALPMDDYAQKTSKLKEKYLDNVTIDGDVVTGNIELDSFKFLYLSIPFSKGWHAYDNGTEVPLYCANDMYMALPLEKGAHSIKLEFKMPLLRTGAVCSLAGVIILLLYIIIHRKKQGLEH